MSKDQAKRTRKNSGGSTSSNTLNYQNQLEDYVQDLWTIVNPDESADQPDRLSKVESTKLPQMP